MHAASIEMTFPVCADCGVRLRGNVKFSFSAIYYGRGPRPSHEMNFNSIGEFSRFDFKAHEWNLLRVFHDDCNDGIKEVKEKIDWDARIEADYQKRLAKRKRLIE